jgi:hypothetical protein
VNVRLGYRAKLVARRSGLKASVDAVLVEAPRQGSSGRRRRAGVAGHRGRLEEADRLGYGRVDDGQLTEGQVLIHDSWVPDSQPGILARIQVCLLTDAETFGLAANVDGAAALIRQHIEMLG